MQGTGRADRGAGPALETDLIIPLDILPDAFNFYSTVFQITDALLVILFVPAQFKDHETLFPGIDVRLENVKGKVEFFYQIHDNGLCYCLFWKSERERFSEHPLASKYSSKTWLAALRATLFSRRLL